MSPLNKNQAEVRFYVRAEVAHGVSIRLSGSIPQLGYFSPSNSIELYTSPQEYAPPFFVDI